MIERVIQSVAAFDSMVPVQNATLADKLSGERHRWFVGRESELSLFEAALADASCSLLFLSGSTGVGKSTLLQEFERCCQEKGHSEALVQARGLVGDGQSSELSRVTALSNERRPRGRGQRPVLLVDSFEALGTQEQALVTQLGYTLPADALLVFASRKWPPQWLLIDPAWSRLARFHELLPWSDEEARKFLEIQGVPAQTQVAVLKVGGGYPLALRVAIQVLRQSLHETFDREDLRNLQASLEPMFSLRASSRTRQVALDVCILVRHTSVELLDHVLRSNPDCDPDGAHDAFEWLANLSFIERHNQQLQPHAVARLTMLPRVRRQQKYRAIFRPVREFYVNELARGSRAEPDFDELVFIDRDIEIWREQDLLAIEGPSLVIAREADHAGIVELVREYEGDIGAEHCQAWLTAVPDSFEVARLAGLQRMLQVTRIAHVQDIPLTDRDPAAQMAARYVEDHPLEDGAVATFFRWFVDRVDYQSPTARVLAISARQTQVIVSLPRVQYSLCVFRNPEEWFALWDSANSVHETVGTFMLDRQRYSLIAFSFAQRPLSELIVEAYRVGALDVPSPIPTSTLPQSSNSEDGDARRTLEQRTAELAARCRLTTRESEVLNLLCLANSIDDIAASLNITARTVRFHQGNLFRKIGATSRIDLFRQLI